MKDTDLKAILENGVTLGYISNLKFDGLRMSSFTVCLDGSELKIEWWCNICYLTTGCGVTVPFHKFKFSGTWPNRAKTNIQLEYEGDTCLIKPVELYTKELV
jgi:hypothetical protein